MPDFTPPRAGSGRAGFAGLPDVAGNRQGVTFRLVEQNARLAFTLARHVYVMEQGRVVLEGPSGDVAASAHVQQAYLGVG